jgi:exosortase/archaeosortase family protein
MRALTKTQKGMLRTGAVFLVLNFAFQVMLLFASRAGVASWATEGTAWVSGVLVRLSGLPVTVSGSEIFLSSRVLSINLDCTSAYVAGTFVALILACPASWRMKLAGIGTGVPIILAANLVRLVAVAQVAVRFPGGFDFVHDYLFQVALLLVAAFLWVAWMAKAKARADEA